MTLIFYLYMILVIFGKKKKIILLQKQKSSTSQLLLRFYLSRDVLNFLKPGGRIGIVLPDAILGAPGLQYVRSWIINHTQVIASVDLHKDTFQPKNGTQTSVLILRKKIQMK